MGMYTFNDASIKASLIKRMFFGEGGLSKSVTL